MRASEGALDRLHSGGVDALGDQYNSGRSTRSTQARALDVVFTSLETMDQRDQMSQ